MKAFEWSGETEMWELFEFEFVIATEPIFKLFKFELESSVARFADKHSKSKS